MTASADHFRDWLPRRADLPGVLLVAAVFWALSHAGFSLSSVARPDALRVSLAAGFAIAAYLLWGYRFWVGVFLGGMAAALESGASLPVALGAAVASAFGNLIGAYLMREWAGFEDSMERLRDVFALLLLGVLAARLVASGIGIANLWFAGLLHGDQWFAVYLNRVIGGAIGVLVVAPLMLAFSKPRTQAWTRASVLEALGILLLLSVVGVVVFSLLVQPQERDALAYLLIPFVIWAAIRFEVRGAAVASVMVLGITLTATANGTGIFTDSARAPLLLALFNTVVAATALIVAASNAERRREHALRSGLEVLRQVFDALPIGLWVTDKAGRILSANAAAGRIWGVKAPTRSEILRRLKVVGGRRARPVESQDLGLLRALDRGETVLDQRLDLEGPEGQLKSLLCSAVPLSGGNNGQSGAVAVYQDVSETICAEKSLRELAAIVEQTDDIVFVTDRSGLIEYVNPSFENATGYARHEVLGRTPAVLKSGRHDKGFYKRLWTTVLAGKPFREVVTNRRKSGELYDEAKTITPVRDEHGNIVHFVSTGKDITERVLAEAERKQLLDVLEASLNEIYIFDPDTLRFRYVNKAALENLGYSAEAMHALTPLNLKPELDADAFRELIAPLLSGKQEQTVFQTVHRRADASLYPVEVHLQLAGQKTQRVFLAVIFDITARKQAEEALRTNEERLRQLSRSLFAAEEDQRRLLARELHDRVGQNVTALALNLNMVRGELPAESLQKVNTRLGDCETLLDDTAQLIRDVMVDLRPPGLDELGLVAALNEHAHQVAGRSGFSATVRGTDVAPRLPPAEEITLFRIAQEALTNVAKHARATEVTLTLESGPDMVILTIADNGRGFDPAARPARPSASLGLVGMRERAESIGGQLRVESAPGQGTRVIVEAPGALPSSAQPGLFS